jgi:hypothetical protein
MAKPKFDRRGNPNRAMVRQMRQEAEQGGVDNKIRRTPFRHRTIAGKSRDMRRDW